MPRLKPSPTTTIKRLGKECSDYLQCLANDEYAHPDNDTPEKLQANAGEKLLLIKRAQARIKQAVKYGVKAANYKKS